MKRFLPILLIALLFSASVLGQDGRTGPGDPGKGLKLYPNPASTNKVALLFTGRDKGNYEITVYSPTGQKLASRILQHNGSSNNYTLPLNASWGAGVYRISIVHKASGKAVNLNLVISR